MRVRRPLRLFPLVVLLIGVPAQAQVVGTLRWQTRPACNLVTLTIVQQGGMYQLTGSDDVCGAECSGRELPTPWWLTWWAS